MAAFVGKEDEADTIEFPESFFKDTTINVEWTIVEEDKKAGNRSSILMAPIESKTFS